MAFGRKVSAYGEGGGGVTSRSGFEIDGAIALATAHYGSGARRPRARVSCDADGRPLARRHLFARPQVAQQPSTRLYTTGIRFHMRPIPAATRSPTATPATRFPQRRSTGLHDQPAELRPQQLLLETCRDLLGRQRRDAAGLHARLPSATCSTPGSGSRSMSGASASYWKSNGNRARFRTLSVYPLFRFSSGAHRARRPLLRILDRRTDLHQPVDDRRPQHRRALHVPGFHRHRRVFRQGAPDERRARHQALLQRQHLDPERGIKIPLTFTVGLAF